MGISILWPTFALVALIFIVFLTMFVTRAGHIKRNPPKAGEFDSGDAALRYFAPIEMPANNYRNLFEMPVLYFALVPLLMITDQASDVQAMLAWLYVALRYLHSFVHIGPKKVPVRALLFALSAVVLMAMWIGFAVDLASAQTAFDRAPGEVLTA
ncbi:MAPEG family protein [Sphingomonas sp. MG17]|uniref:MAPEG family protein n=1 Tax=Sphingomonas tagetis TaxID=2949092 RepID=A0A9X2HLF3_9SPHN|nr:MAPEG family protein [Sphingomonas tagetis]MCP3731827.1 MAPEG family protein [Sphingomonas tagetis]